MFDTPSTTVRRRQLTTTVTATVALLLLAALLPLPANAGEGSVGTWPPPKPDFDTPFTVERITETPDGEGANGSTWDSALSRDGQMMGYIIDATNLAPSEHPEAPVILESATGVRTGVVISETYDPGDGGDPIGQRYPAQGSEIALDADGSTVALIAHGPRGDGLPDGQIVRVITDVASGTFRDFVVPSDFLHSVQLSDSGDTVAFLAVNDAGATRTTVLYVARLSGTAAIEVADLGAGYPSYALHPSGERAVYYRWTENPAYQSDFGPLGDWVAWEVDLNSLATQQLVVALTGAGDNGPPASPAYSGDGQVLAIGTSVDGQLQPLVIDADGQHHIGAFTGGHDEPRLVGGLLDLALDGDGSTLAFTLAEATMTEQLTQVWVYDRDVERLSLVSATPTGAASAGRAESVAISPDGTVVVFESDAPDLVAGDTGGFVDVFRTQRADIEWSEKPAWPADASLLAEVVRETEVDLAWPSAQDDGAGGVVAYQVVVEGRRKQVLPAPGDTQRVTVDGLRGASHYRLEVVALDEQNQRSAPLAVEVDTLPPMAAWLDTNVTSTAVELLWSPPAGHVNGDGYRVVRTEDGVAGEEHSNVDGLENTKFVDETVLPDTTYTYRVERVDGAATYAYAGPVDVTTPAPDAGLVADTTRRGQIELSWAADAAGADGYQIRRGTSGADLAVLATVDDAQLTFVDTDVYVGTRYVYRVDSLRGDVPRRYTKEVAVTARAGAALWLSSIGGDVRLVWSASPTADGYRIERAQGDGDFEAIADVAAGTAEYVDTGLPADTYLRYRVVELVGDETVPLTAEETITTAGLEAPTGSVSTDNAGLDVIARGSAIEIQATGQSGRQASATIAYTTWYAPDSTELLDEPRPVTTEVELTGTGGTYLGSFTLPDGTAGVDSVLVRLSDGADAGAESENLLERPAEVSGGFDLTVTEDGEYTRATATSAGLWQTFVRPVTDRSASADRLRPGREWRITLLDDAGNSFGKETFTVKPGLLVPVAIDPQLFAQPTLKVQWAGGRPADASIGGELTDVRGRRRAAAVMDAATDSSTFSHHGLREDEIVRPRITVNPYSYHGVIEGDFVAYARSIEAPELALDAGPSELLVVAEPLPQARIAGRLTEAGTNPLVGAVIRATQTVDERPWSYRAVTGDDGSFSMPVLAGSARVTALLPGDVAPVVLLDGELLSSAQEVDVSRDFSPAREYTIEPTLRSISADETEGVVQQIQHRQIRARWPMWLDRAGHHSNYQGSPWVVQARPGTSGLVCGRDSTSRHSQTCISVAFGDDTTIAATVAVNEATRILATVEGADGAVRWGGAQLFEEQDGTMVVIEAASVRDGVVEMHAGAGTYELRVEASGQRGSTTVVVAGEPQVDEHVFLSESSDWIFTPESGISVTPAVAAAGGLLDLRASTRLGTGLEPIEDASVRFQLPGALQVRGIQVDGQPLTEDEADLPQPDPQGVLDVPLSGVLDSDAARVVRVQLATPTDLVGRVTFDAAVHGIGAGGETEEWILGGAFVDVGVLTFEAPSLSTTRDVWLSGRGPIGASVDLYVDGVPISTVASIPPGGRWRHRVTLPPVDGRGTFELHAIARVGELEQRTGSRPVTVDITEARMTRVQVYQEGGRFVEFDPADGVALFPYVFNPHQKTYVRLHFEQADRVENVRIRVVDTEVVAERQADGWFHAELQTKKFGRISTRYDVAALPMGSLDDVQLPSVPENARRTPDVFRGWVDSTPDDAPESSASFVLPALSDPSCDPAEPSASGCVEMTMSMEIDRGAPYSPTEEDAVIERLSGVEVSVPDFDVTSTNGTISIVVSAGMGEAFLPAAPAAGAVAEEVVAHGVSGPQTFYSAGVAAARAGGGRAWMRIDINGLKERYETAEEVYEHIEDLVEGFKHLEELIDRIAYLRRWHSKCPGATTPNGDALYDFVPTVLDRIQNSIRVAQIADAQNRIFFERATLGAGGLLFSKVGEVMSMAWRTGFGRDLDWIERALRAAECPPPPAGGGTTSSGGSGGGSGSGGDDGGDGDGGGDTLADATPIYDPSGYVYEGMQSNRIEGVTATVMQADAEEGPWTVWDAEWFGQINPQLTDPSGRYGWDVPEDWWQVVFTKDGYHQAMSDELLVLPPHFDVNIGITSVVPAAVSDASSAAGDSGGLLLEFDRPVQVASVLDERADNVVVRRGEEEVAGTWAAVGAEEDPERDGELAMMFRFTPAEPLIAGETLVVATEVGVRDYADRPLQARDDRSVTVAAVPVDPGGGPGGGGTPGGGGGAPAPGRGGVPVAAPTGDGPVMVTVETPAGPARIELHGVRNAGTIDVTAGDGASRRGFRLLDTWFELDTDVAFRSATVCLPYDEAEMEASGFHESALYLLHGMDDGTVEDVTSFREDGRVCGRVTSFSPFWLGAPATDRLAGPDRYATAAAISRETFDAGVDVVYVVTASTFADGLVGGPAAARLGAPVLLTDGHAVPAATRDELHRLRPGRIEVLGGSAAVSEAVITELRSLTRGAVTRTAGADRYSTAAELARSAFGHVDTVYVATGTTFADALVAGAAAIRDGAPLLLVPGGEVPDSVRNAVAALSPETIVIVGGTGAVSDAIARQLAATGAEVSRLAGADRYATAARIAAEAGGGRPVVAASGETFADALAGLPLAAAHGAALVLVAPTAVPSSVRDVLDDIRTPRLTVLGGTAAVSRSAELTLASTMAG